jgi:multimeric flavodoxin WrbA
MEKGNTARLLSPFVQGMRDAGCQTELVYASRLELKPCTGEMHCWYRKPGECYLKDDMQTLYPRLQEADILVLATPVYIPLPGQMQVLINRLCPLLEPRLESRDGRTRARFRPDVAIERVALVATGGWWERANMDTLVRIAREIAEDASVAFAGAVLRPHAFLMARDGELTEDGRAVAEAARHAAHELVIEGFMREPTLAAVSRPLIGEEELRARYNAWLSG